MKSFKQHIAEGTWLVDPAKLANDEHSKQIAAKVHAASAKGSKEIAAAYKKHAETAKSSAAEHDTSSPHHHAHMAIHHTLLRNAEYHKAGSKETDAYRHHDAKKAEHESHLKQGRKNLIAGYSSGRSKHHTPFNRAMRDHQAIIQKHMDKS